MKKQQINTPPTNKILKGILFNKEQKFIIINTLGGYYFPHWTYLILHNDQSRKKETLKSPIKEFKYVWQTDINQIKHRFVKEWEVSNEKSNLQCTLSFIH